MPTYEYVCPDCGQDFDKFCKMSERKQTIHEGCVSIAKQVIRTPAKPNWSALAMGESASPEAINHFDRMHKDKAAKEEKAIREHGSIN